MPHIAASRAVKQSDSEIPVRSPVGGRLLSPKPAQADRYSTILHLWRGGLGFMMQVMVRDTKIGSTGLEV